MDTAAFLAAVRNTLADMTTPRFFDNERGYQGELNVGLRAELPEDIIPETVMVYERALNIYVDGSSYSAPRRGGIGVRYVTINEQGNEVVIDDTLTGHAGATNNEMELLACVKALEGAVDHPQFGTIERIYLFSDSMYVCDNVNRAKFEWHKQKWCNRHGKPVENAELWKQLVRLLKRVSRRVDFEWVKGHANDQHNQAVDRLAKQSAKGVLNKPLKVTAVRKKNSREKVKPGCVPMQGQVLSIRIVTDTFMRTQRLYKYKYEVLSDTGPHSDKVDLIYHETQDPLRAGHHYEIRVNTEIKNPRIVDVVREIERNPPQQSADPH